jgi:hypothetical protein
VGNVGARVPSVNGLAPDHREAKRWGQQRLGPGMRHSLSTIFIGLPRAGRSNFDITNF